MGASASESSATFHSTNSDVELYYPGKGKKRGGHRERRINKKRKRKCHQFGRKAYAG